MDAPDDRESHFAAARARMVREQLAARGVTDARVLEAMAAVPRHLFVPPAYRGEAYDDRALPIDGGQTISQPFMVALMTQWLAVQPGATILEIGTGSGYQAAVLARLANRVVTIERHADLSAKANALFRYLGVSNIECLVGDGTLGWPPLAPYGGVIVTAGAPAVPEALRAQLADGGRLVVPVGGRDAQRLEVIRRSDGAFERALSVECRFVPLIGEEGWRGE